MQLTHIITYKRGEREREKKQHTSPTTLSCSYTYLYTHAHLLLYKTRNPLVGGDRDRSARASPLYLLAAHGEKARADRAASILLYLSLSLETACSRAHARSKHGTSPIHSRNVCHRTITTETTTILIKKINSPADSFCCSRVKSQRSSATRELWPVSTCLISSSITSGILSLSYRSTPFFSINIYIHTTRTSVHTLFFTLYLTLTCTQPSGTRAAVTLSGLRSKWIARASQPQLSL